MQLVPTRALLRVAFAPSVPYERWAAQEQHDFVKPVSKTAAIALERAASSRVLKSIALAETVVFLIGRGLPN